MLQDTTDDPQHSADDAKTSLNTTYAFTILSLHWIFAQGTWQILFQESLQQLYKVERYYQLPIAYERLKNGTIVMWNLNQEFPSSWFSYLASIVQKHFWGPKYFSRFPSNYLLSSLSTLVLIPSSISRVVLQEYNFLASLSFLPFFLSPEILFLHVTGPHRTM